MEENLLSPCKINVSSETGRLRAVLLHKPGVEIERMTPINAHEALYSDILNKNIVDKEYRNFCGVLEKWTQVYYVEDILEQLLTRQDIRAELASDHVIKLAEHMAASCGGNNDRALAHALTKILIEGYENPQWDGESADRYLVKPLYNLFFTRDASSTVYDRVLINSMSFDVRKLETLIYQAIFKHFFKVETINALSWDANARTEGGDVQIASPELLCIGQGIRTNPKGIEYLAQKFAAEKDHFNIIVQELPEQPESFIHLDMVFTFLGKHQCMAFEPMLTKKGLFSGKDTTLISIDGGKITYRNTTNILTALAELGMDLQPVICGGNDPWVQEREQWHSGANFFALGDGKVIGYERNMNTIEALNKAGFDVLSAPDIVNGTINMNEHEKFVAVFPAGELPRAGGGARCMTMPLLRDPQ